MSDYATRTAALIKQVRDWEAKLPLRNAHCGSQFWMQPQKSRRVCLFFHGFTAAPYQFVPLGSTLAKAGYTVLAPLLPGHGQAGTWNQAKPSPLPEDPQRYQDFARYWLQQARLLGDQVIVGGLSAGGTLSTWLALEYPTQIYRTLLFAPFLSSSNLVIDMFVKTMDCYQEWKVDPGKVPIGYTGFTAAALRVFLNMGQESMQRAQTQPLPPIFCISSESDIAVDNYDHRTLIETARKRQPRAWYLRFDKVLDIPHAMMTQMEGNQYVDLLNVLARAFIESDLTWAEIEEISYRMTQGRTFPAVVAELGLGARVSKDLPALITMVDKRAIALSRNPNQNRPGRARGF